MQKIKVVIWGFGAMGQGMADMILSKKGVEITGVCDLSPKLMGEKVFQVLSKDRNAKNDVTITGSIDDLLDRKKCDIVLLTTDSLTKRAYKKIAKVVAHGINVISTAEEMAYPKAREPGISRELDDLARKNKATVLGTGINPGFIMDFLVIALSGTMNTVEYIEANRVNSLSPFGAAVMKEQGVGITVGEFEERVKNNDLAGHIGFRESVAMIADAMGVKLNAFKQQMTPIITEVPRQSKYGRAPKGSLAGVNMTGQGIRGGRVFINMKHPQQIEPELGGISTGDHITLKGRPNINMTITPEIDGGIGTIAICVNMIPHVLNARPGLKSMIDLPVPRAILGDMRDILEKEG